jgi:hypothetical protein
MIEDWKDDILDKGTRTMCLHATPGSNHHRVAADEASYRAEVWISHDDLAQMQLVTTVSDT